MKPAIREAIDREDVTIVLFKPTLEIEQGAGLAEGQGGAMAQTQADGKRVVRTNAFPDRQGMIFNGIKGFPPGFPAMNIGAIRQMEAVVQDHGREAERIIFTGAR